MAVTMLTRGVLPFAFPGLPSVRCAFTTRETGNISLYRTAPGENGLASTHATRRALLSSLGQDLWTELKQVHGDTFLIDPAPSDMESQAVLEADGLATSRVNHVLCIKTADCQPILLAHPQGCIAAIHAGWRGNVLAFPTSAVAAFCNAYGVEPSEVRAVRGPSLGHAEFVNFDQEWPERFTPWYDRKSRCMDLWALTRSQLREAGLQDRHIYGMDMCTYSLQAAFFSHRRGDAGRQAGLVWMEEARR